jgi:hypothetical protein
MSYRRRRVLLDVEEILESTWYAEFVRARDAIMGGERAFIWFSLERCSDIIALEYILSELLSNLQILHIDYGVDGTGVERVISFQKNVTDKSAIILIRAPTDEDDKVVATPLLVPALVSGMYRCRDLPYCVCVYSRVLPESAITRSSRENGMRVYFINVILAGSV